MRNLSIRIRLTLWYGGVLVIVLAVFGASVFFTMQHQMLSRIDHGLREEMSDVLSEVERADSRAGMLEWLDRRFGQHQGFDFQITTADGNRVFVNERLGEQAMPVPAALQPDEDVFESHSERMRRAGELSRAKSMGRKQRLWFRSPALWKTTTMRRANCCLSCW